MKDTVASKVDASAQQAVHKQDRSRVGRFLRLIGAAVDPRAWAHLIKIVNYYNYTHVAPRRAAHLGHDVRLSPTVSLSNPSNVHIGDRARIGAGCNLWCGPSSGRIVIGTDALFGPNVMITAASYRIHDGSPVTKQPMKEADVILGHDVWVGYGAVILAGTTVGDGAIIGANAVVRGNVPPNAIISGNPATQTGTRNPDRPGAPKSDL